MNKLIHFAVVAAVVTLLATITVGLRSTYCDPVDAKIIAITPREFNHLSGNTVYIETTLQTLDGYRLTLDGNLGQTGEVVKVQYVKGNGWRLAVP